MGPFGRTHTIFAVFALASTAFSCSLPFFKGGLNSNGVLRVEPKASKLSGLVQFSESCPAGYYQVRLQGLHETSNVQVSGETDAAGKFSLSAPAGRYLMWVNKDGCGSKEPVELQENTEHMVSVFVGEINSVERMENSEGRLPASVLELTPTSNH